MTLIGTYAHSCKLHSWSYFKFIKLSKVQYMTFNPYGDYSDNYSGISKYHARRESSIELSNRSLQEHMISRMDLRSYTSS